ncbi:N-acetylglucosamine/diacetylchitobiose ABC transporter substrate-binding protein [Phytomonospora sp. NPDC050363]|uniref:N-acetylglucosamine/diacetylchitobiose ABC transporter substrate-binding protein n=1 Tax=Phytomonospora sp. NPDC050363 TaxID=3155642 RepID=UPI0033CA4050
MPPKPSSGSTRRQILRRGAAAAVAAGPAAGLLAGCSPAEEEASAPLPLSNTGGPSNPFNVDGERALDVVIFNGGYSDRYAAEGHEVIYHNRYPEAPIQHIAVTQISEQLNPLLVAGRPPDVVNNSGAHQVPADELFRDGHLTDLTLLLDAPSFDDPDVKVRDTLRPGIIPDGSLGLKGQERMHLLYYGYTAFGLWYNKTLFDDRGWEVPASWPEFTDLCGRIRGQGISPLIFQGQYPYYLLEPFMTLAVRHGGIGVARAIDELEPGSWDNDSVRMAAQALYDLGESGYVHNKAVSASHTEAQDLWNADEAAFIPCGTWLENEQRDKTPPDFEMQIMAMPPLEGSVSPGTVCASGTEAFIVPALARNRAGGLEYLRMMLSKEGAKQFTSRVSSLTCVAGAEEGLDAPGVRSTNELLKTAGKDVYAFYFDKRYRAFADKTVGPAIRELLSNARRPDDFVRDMQKATDALRKSGAKQSIA